MPTATDIQNVVEEKVLDSVRVGQKAVVDSVRSWAETVETVYARLPEVNFSDAPVRPTEAFERAFGFAEKLLATQRDFAAQVLEASVPAAKAGVRASQNASQNASKTASKA